MTTTAHKCEAKLFEKMIKRAPKNNINKRNKQRKENKRGVKAVDKMEAEIATTTAKKVSITKSPVLEAGGSTKACR